MIHYKYTALDQNNNVITGSIDAASEIQARDILASQGQKLIKIKREALAKAGPGEKSISGPEIAVFCKELSIITKSGISILKGLAMICSQSHNRRIRQLAENINVGIQKGYSLSEAFKNCGYRLPLLLVNMIRIGEVSGNLDDIFRRMADYFQKEAALRKKVVGAMIYPAILLCVSVGVIIIFTFFVLPQLVEIIEDTGGKLPLITRIMMGSANFVKDNIVYIIIALIVLAIVYVKGIPYEMKNKAKGWLMLRIPGAAGISKDFITTRFVRTAGILFNTGLPMLVILDTLEKVIGNEEVGRGIAAARDNINKGESLSNSLQQIGFFDTMVINIIAIGEETGRLSESLMELAEYYDERFESTVARFISLIEPAFTLGMGAVIATILLSAMLPMFDMIGNMSNMMGR